MMHLGSPTCSQLSLGQYLILDVETTGLDAGTDEIIQLAIINQQETVLFNRLIRPIHTKTWPEAQRVSGIAPQCLMDEQPFLTYKDAIQQIIDDHDTIVAYNAAFELSFLAAQGLSLSNKNSFCVMQAFAPIYGQRRRGSKGFVWKSLEVCAQFYDVANPKAHDALSDALTTLACLKAMLESGEDLLLITQKICHKIKKQSKPRNRK